MSVGLALVLSGGAEAGQLRKLHNFTAYDGAGPSGNTLLQTGEGNIIHDADGNIYGTTEHGGAGGAGAPGVVFKLAPDENLTVLHNFNGKDGSFPAGLRQDPATGDLFGVTVLGGNMKECGRQGCGVIYKLTPDGTETVLYRFSESSFYFPFGLRRDSAGNLFGAVQRGAGSNGGEDCGALYELTAKGKFKILHEFDTAHGCGPTSRLVMDKKNNLYGTTRAGGAAGWGVVFRLAPSGTYIVLHDFDGYKGGALPVSVVRDDVGNIYGTTIWGGDHLGGEGDGIVFKLASGGQFIVLHRFTGGYDGAMPDGEPITTSDGTVYGTTAFGGCCRCYFRSCGTIFRIAPDGTFTTLYRFPKSRTGSFPNALLAKDGDPNIYGTTLNGGTADSGTIFKIRR